MIIVPELKSCICE